MNEPPPPKKPLWRWFRALGCVLALGVVTAGFVAGWVQYQAQHFLQTSPSPDGVEVVIEITHGTSGRAVADLLAERGVVTDAQWFYWLLRYREAVPGIRAGEFAFRTDWTPDEVIDALHHAQEVTYPLSIPEGLRYLAVAERVEAAGRGWSAETFVALCRDPVLLERAGIDAGDVEGYLLPETYHLSRHASERDVFDAMLAEFDRSWGEEQQAAADALGMTRHEVVILASLVEKETGQAAERPRIASVFHNRLKIDMKLECDPTIVYGIEDYDGVIHKSDISNPHPWNTYVHPGLPRGPIANPGAVAIQAALHPEQSKYLYFVSKNDGTHHFSTSYAEHARMVNRYQR